MNLQNVLKNLHLPISRQLINGETIEIRLLQNTDNQLLNNYFEALSAETLNRFQPHSLDKSTIEQICQNPTEGYCRLVAFSPAQAQIIAYFLVFWGVLPKDQARYEALGIALKPDTDCTFAPSVADNYQNQKLGSLLMPILLKICHLADYQRIILWGGVQAENPRALRFYQKFGFTTIGSFQNKNSHNWDMYYTLENPLRN
jgi:diamine N-acetyltransferase